MTTAQILDAVNARFYEHHADSFDRSRHAAWPGWHDCIAQTPSRDLRVLDLACGNGRLMDFLADASAVHGRRVQEYIGLEREPTLCAKAQERHPPFRNQIEPWTWTDTKLPQSLSPAIGFDWVTVFGVMHHVFGETQRLELLRFAAQQLRPGGCLSVSLWDFGAHGRYEAKYLKWEAFSHSWGLDLSTLEAGDFLLGWGSDTEHPRYCHWVDREEEKRLIDAVSADPDLGLMPGLKVGSSKDLNRYWCWTRRASTG